jgi:hypothetical protein
MPYQQQVLVAGNDELRSRRLRAFDDAVIRRVTYHGNPFRRRNATCCGFNIATRLLDPIQTPLARVLESADSIWCRDIRFSSVIQQSLLP